VTFKFVVRKIARQYGLHATFMPKPLFGKAGSGMHTHQSLFKGKSTNAFYDEDAKYQLSKTAMNYIGGLLAHARGFAAITNPLVNSYKRLVPGYEAPVYIAWSEKNRSPLVRIPARRGLGTRAELRNPDPACNPYLALAVTLKAGLDGIKKKTDPGDPVNLNIYHLTERQKKDLNIKSLPASLSEALDELEADDAVRSALGPHVYENFMTAKRIEWDEYRTQVFPWEIERYLGVFLTPPISFLVYYQVFFVQASVVLILYGYFVPPAPLEGPVFFRGDHDAALFHALPELDLTRGDHLPAARTS